MAQSTTAEPVGRQAAAKPPAGMPFREVFGVHALLDEEGRPLGEHRAPSGLAGVAPTQLKPCRYAGSRHNHRLPMNASALRQTSQHWDEIVAGIGFLRRAHHGAAPALTLAELWRLLAAVAVLPSYLRYRVRREPATWVPQASVAAIYKASLGIKYMLESQLLREILEGGSAYRSADVEELSGLTESSGALVGVEQVCAAPANMITDTLRAFIHASEPGVADGSALAAIVEPLEAYHRFTVAAYDLYSTLLVFSTLGARTQLALEKELAPQTPATGEAYPAKESSRLEVSMSLTLGMRRLRWPLARLDEFRCAAALCAFADVTRGEEAPENAAVALLATLDSPEAPRRKALGCDLERVLAPQVGGTLAPMRLAKVCDLLAWHVDLENAAAVRVQRAERRLNEALARDFGADDVASALAGYCPVSPWSLAAERLGVPLAHEPGADAIRCGNGHIIPPFAPGLCQLTRRS